MEQTLKIAYCIPALYYPSGMERVLVLKANYLVEKYHYDIHIILTDGKGKQPAFKLNSSICLHQLDINFDDFRGIPLYKRIWIYQKKQRLFKQRLAQCLTTIKPDITVSLLRRDINLLDKIKDGSVKIGEIHFNKSNYRSIQIKHFPCVSRLINKLWMNQLISHLRHLEKFVVLTHEDAEEWTELNNVTVIPNPLSFLPTVQSDCKSYKVIAVGRFVPQKGFDRLIPAWKIVVDKHPDWELHIYGDGMRTELQSLIDSLGIQSSCSLEHSVQNIVDKYCESSIFVLSSRFEGFGMVIIEAMACGVPPISFSCPCGPRDIIADGHDGFLVENGNIDQLANKICYFIEHENKRVEMGQYAKEDVMRYSIDKIMPQWKELFESVLTKK